MRESDVVASPHVVAGAQRSKEFIQKLAETVEALGDLAKQIGYAVQSWAALIVAVAAFFI